MSVAFKNGVVDRRKGPLIDMTHRSFDWEGEKGGTSRYGRSGHYQREEGTRPQWFLILCHFTTNKRRTPSVCVLYALQFNAARVFCFRGGKKGTLVVCALKVDIA
ncbi:hypothetical protein NPIL_119591 [Nephila pilipes]|uniref:Uncharacterized protein n=1 Tax=Nephila pilipes TaxID=299642 RepID=A0A8X6P585_NEPPI|nr:hypothetical protein NPIL_119591 [Nephila pilipes]